MKKCRFGISAGAAFRNLSIRTRINDVPDVGIDFRSPGKSLQSIFLRVPHGTCSGICLTRLVLLISIGDFQNKRNLPSVPGPYKSSDRG